MINVNFLSCRLFQTHTRGLAKHGKCLVSALRYRPLRGLRILEVHLFQLFLHWMLDLSSSNLSHGRIFDMLAELKFSWREIMVVERFRVCVLPRMLDVGKQLRFFKHYILVPIGYSWLASLRSVMLSFNLRSIDAKECRIEAWIRMISEWDSLDNCWFLELLALIDFNRFRHFLRPRSFFHANLRVSR